MPSNELFYLDAQGKKQDAALHEEILGGIAPEAASALLEDTRERARAAGFNEKMIRTLYPSG